MTLSADHSGNTEVSERFVDGCSPVAHAGHRRARYQIALIGRSLLAANSADSTLISALRETAAGARSAPATTKAHKAGTPIELGADLEPISEASRRAAFVCLGADPGHAFVAIAVTS